jgi:hypothetical protein
MNHSPSIQSLTTQTHHSWTTHTVGDISAARKKKISKLKFPKHVQVRLRFLGQTLLRIRDLITEQNGLDPNNPGVGMFWVYVRTGFRYPTLRLHCLKGRMSALLPGMPGLGYLTAMPGPLPVCI